MDEDLEKRAIEAMPVVSSLCFHAADAKNKRRLSCQPQVWLWCEAGGAHPQVGPILRASFMLFFSVSRCAKALCQKTIQLLVQGMLACARARTWIPVKWPRSVGARLYAF
jgi:hypothetical protein